MKITQEDLEEFKDRFDHVSCYGGKVSLTAKEGFALLEHIEAQAAKIAEQQAVIDQRNAECDRLIIEKGLARVQSAPSRPFGWLRVVSGKAFQIMEGTERPPDRSGECAGPWFAVYTDAQPVPAAPVAVPDDIPSDETLEQIEEAARIGYRRHMTAIRGQQISPLDSVDYWYILTAWQKCIDEVLRLNNGSKPE